MIDLSRIDLATEEDRLYAIDEWAKLFKATSWEDLKMLAKTNAALAEAGATIYEISADEHLRQQLEAREDAIRQERGMLRRLEHAEKERDDAVAKLDATAAKLDATAAKLDTAENRIAELEKQLADKEAEKKE